MPVPSPHDQASYLTFLIGWSSRGRTVSYFYPPPSKILQHRLQVLVFILVSSRSRLLNDIVYLADFNGFGPSSAYAQHDADTPNGCGEAWRRWTDARFIMWGPVSAVATVHAV
jgi:hypothetical protein